MARVALSESMLVFVSSPMRVGHFGPPYDERVSATAKDQNPFMGKTLLFQRVFAWRPDSSPRFVYGDS